jgi:hypothetical protein
MTIFRTNLKATEPGLEHGVAIYTPTPGDILRDIWLEVVTAWNASPALADVGTLIGSSSGLYGLAAGGPVDVTEADAPAGGSFGDVLIGATETDLSVAAGIGAASPAASKRPAPARFTSPAPLKVVVSIDGTTGGGTPATVTADAAPDFAGGWDATVTADAPPEIASATVTATDAPEIAAPAKATVTAGGGPTVPLHILVSKYFKFGAPGSELVYTVAPGNYTTLAALDAAMQAAAAPDLSTLGDICTVSDDGTDMVLTANATGDTWNGWHLQPGPGGDFLAYSGFTNGQALEGGTAGGLTVVEGSNDRFQFGAPGSEVHYYVAAGNYATAADIAAAMAAAVDTESAPLSALVGIAAGEAGKLIATAVTPGSSYNGYDFLAGPTDFLAGSGFSSGQALEGGQNAGLTVVEGVNDTLKFGAPGEEATYTVAPGNMTTLVEVELAMLAATAGAVPLYSVVGLGDNGTELTAGALSPGSSYNGYDFLAGPTDFLAGSGFSSGQALEGGEDSGLTVVEGVNDTLKFGAPHEEQTYTVAPGDYSSLAELETALGAAHDGEVLLSTSLDFTDLGGKLIATMTVDGSGYNGYDLVAGPTDVLAATGFSSGQALEGGTAGGGGATGATEGELNVYVEVEAAYPPAPWYAPAKPAVPPFPYEGKV